MRKDRLIIGLLCILFAVWVWFTSPDSAPAIGMAVLGVIMLAISRKK